MAVEDPDMQGEGGAATPVPPVAHPIEERLEQLDEAARAGAARRQPEAAVERQHERGKLTARERLELLLDPGSFVELDMLARHRAHGFGIEENRAAHRRRRHRVGHGRRPQGLRLRAGLHRLRRRARRGVRREDPQGHGSRRVRRRAVHRTQRRRRRPHPGRRRLAGGVTAASSTATSGRPGSSRRSAWSSGRAPAARSTRRR